MHFPESIYSFFANQSDHATTYLHLEDKAPNVDALKAQINRLIQKHKNYQKTYEPDSKVSKRASNKIKILAYCLNYLSNSCDYQQLLNEQATQDKLPVDERYDYNDSWWQTVGLGYFWQALPSETATVVKSTKQFIKSQSSKRNFFMSSDALFEDRPNNTGISPVTTPKAGAL